MTSVSWLLREFVGIGGRKCSTLIETTRIVRLAGDDEILWFRNDEKFVLNYRDFAMLSYKLSGIRSHQHTGFLEIIILCKLVFKK